MPGKLKFIIIILAVILLGFFLAVFFGKNSFKSASKKNFVFSSASKNSEEKTEVAKNFGQFFVSGWVPYWKKNDGIASLSGNLDAFSEINPFAYEVNPDGSIFDKSGVASSPWPEFLEKAKEKNVRIVPTILWSDDAAMHNVFSDPALLENHINNIYELLEKNNYPGVDIDYEGKDAADRDNYSHFLELLQKKLVPAGKSISCTVEAITQDNIPEGWSGTKAMGWANDLSALNKFCTSVRVMAYDQAFQIHREKTFEDPGSQPSAPNAGNQWVEEVVGYFLRYIDPQKLVLGTSTYGWEFEIEKTDQGYKYTYVTSVSFPDAMKKSKIFEKTPERIDGELVFTFNSDGKEYLVTFDDAESVKQKIEIAKKYNLQGVSLFKIDGLADPKLFSALKSALK